MNRINIEKKEEKKKTILKKSKELFSERGYNETKVEDITQELGISKGNFYTYFNFKEEVLCEILETGKREIREMLNKIDISRSPSEILWEYFKFKIECFLERFKKINLKFLDEILKNEKIKSAKRELHEMEITFLEENVFSKYEITSDRFMSEYIYNSLEYFLFNEVLEGRIGTEETYVERKKEDLKKIISFIDKGLK